MDKNEIFELIITQMTELAVMEYMKDCGEEETQRYKELNKLHLLCEKILETISPEDRQVLEDYFVKSNIIADHECQYLYVQGAKDCVELLKKLGAL